MRALTALRAAFLIIGFASATSAAAELSCRMAITFDDLPTVGLASTDNASRLQMTENLLALLSAREIRVTGFVNEQKLLADGQIDAERTAILRLWLDAGHELGNHSYSHPDLHRTPLSEFQADVLRGETVLRPLLAEYDRDLAYFRHPYLHTGTDLDTKRRFESFLKDHGYKVAPVTIDNADWVFARAFDHALAAGDTGLAKRIGLQYVSYMIEMVIFYEGQSQQLFARNIEHVLLVHANTLNSVWFGALADRLSDMGFEFISLDEALEDSAYASEDRYTGPGGITWLHRWAITREVDPAMFHGEPEPPQFVVELAELP